MKHGCRVRIRESGKERGRERERESVYIRRIFHPWYDTGDYEKLEKSKIRHYGSSAVFGGKPISKCRFHFRNPWQFPHCRITRGWFDPISLRSLSPSQYWMFYIFEIPFFPSFLRREGSTRSNSFPSYCPASWDTTRKVNHLESPTTFKFYNTLRRIDILGRIPILVPSPLPKILERICRNCGNAEDFKILNRRTASCRVAHEGLETIDVTRFRVRCSNVEK